MKIAVTGGMGCGKSTVVKVMKELLPHYTFASYDEEVRNMYANNWKFRDDLRFHFGTVERAEVAKIVFADDAKMRLLMLLTEYPMMAFMQSVTSNLNVVMEVPMLYEIPGASDLFDKRIAVWCDARTQMERIRARDGLTEKQVMRRLDYHLSAEEKARRSDLIIDTSDWATDVKVQISAALDVAELNRV